MMVILFLDCIIWADLSSTWFTGNSSLVVSGLNDTYPPTLCTVGGKWPVNPGCLESLMGRKKQRNIYIYCCFCVYFLLFLKWLQNVSSPFSIRGPYVCKHYSQTNSKRWFPCSLCHQSLSKMLYRSWWFNKEREKEEEKGKGGKIGDEQDYGRKWKWSKLTSKIVYIRKLRHHTIHNMRAIFTWVMIVLQFFYCRSTICLTWFIYLFFILLLVNAKRQVVYQ